MRFINAALLLAHFSSAAFAQPEEEKKRILIEGTKLYQSEMASWYGTDLFLEKFPERQSRVKGYFSYTKDGKPTCLFFSGEEPRKIIGSFAFDESYDTGTAVIDGEERDLTPIEADLIAIRTVAINEYSSDREMFKNYKDMNPNFIPLIDDQGKRVYVLTGPKNQGVVVFGNDYLLTFDNNNNLVSKRPLHKNIIPIYSKDSEQAVTTMHTHLPENGDLMTATDICTLKLYCPFTGWKQHYVISSKTVSVWDCENGLVTLPREAWDKLNKQKK
jgi:hypothetical protein